MACQKPARGAGLPVAPAWRLGEQVEVGEEEEGGSEKVGSGS